eukprot:8429637-Alexandrium_andersonii.AAC.1
MPRWGVGPRRPRGPFAGHSFLSLVVARAVGQGGARSARRLLMCRHSVQCCRITSLNRADPSWAQPAP